MAEQPPDFVRGGRQFFQKHCLHCHSGKEPKAELSLDVFRDSASVVKQRKVWNNVLKMIRAGDMPPSERPQPNPKEVEEFTAHVKVVFDYAHRHAKPDPGRVTMRRLNRIEHKNTVRDLLGGDFDPTESFPADDVGHGFDNIGGINNAGIAVVKPPDGEMPSVPLLKCFPAMLSSGIYYSSGSYH